MTGSRPPLAVVTPTHAPDLPLFERLHASVLANTPQSTVHHVIVNVPELPLFRRFEGPRCRLVTVDDLFPGTFLKVPGRSLWLNRRAPLPPVRGWVLQQLLKLQAVAQLDAVTLVADSDVVLIGEVDAGTFHDGSPVVAYSVPGAVRPDMVRHVRWHHVARRLLGLPPGAPPFDDHVSSFNVWVPDVVRAMLRRIEETTGRPWERAVGANLHVSEFILYGVFAAALLPPSEVAPTSHLGCLNYWGTEPLDRAAALALVEELVPGDVAVMISSKSSTPLEVRDEMVAACVAQFQR